MPTWILSPAASPLRGRLVPPPDKSISHRGALFAALAAGTSRVENFLAAEDCLASVALVRALGATAALGPDGALTVESPGLAGLREPEDVLDCGNSGTTMRLAAGLLAGVGGHAVLTGDASLRRRPMARVVEPLRAMGARIDGRGGGRLAPLAIRGGGLEGLDYASPIASAQVKSALLLAGLFAAGETRVSEPARSRDHTERMLEAMGADLTVDGLTVSLRPGRPLRPLRLRVPGDVSSAAFWIVAAAIVPGSDLTLAGVGVNPTRTGLLDALEAMGTRIERLAPRTEGGEPVCDLRVRHAPLRATRVEGDLVPRMIDELPVFAVAAGLAEGETVVADAAELRAKESDRIRAVASRLGTLGLAVSERPDGFVVAGRPGRYPGGETASGGDHRIAMAAAVMGLASEKGAAVADVACVQTSYPGFFEHLGALAEGATRITTP